MSARRPIGNTEYLKKRIPQNPKYQHVKSRLDTGCSLLKYMERLDEIKRNCRYKKGELFKRLKVTTFAQLVIQVASVSDLNDVVIDGETSRLSDNISVLSGGDSERLSERSNGSPHNPSPQLNNNSESGDTGFSPRSTLQSVISGVGEMDLDKNGQRSGNLTPEPSPRVGELPYPDCPYLLLDVRNRDDYDQCHIISAYSYPVATLSRTMNPYTKEVLDYKNAPGKIIILYDEDERIASQAATTMCERGFENLFMLSGGLKVVAQKIPEGLTTGSIPAHCLPSPTPTGGRKRPAPPQVSHPAEKKWRFTSDDLGKIQMHLEEVLVPSDSSSRLSRMSMSSAQSKVSSARSRQDSARSQSSRPWK
ncbi:centrosomal protein of 41 kDa-like [Megalops cyprinoides]|uniref:centrosomal protein of 41 kDa-like n=1 Tax=Megalops cyprinoides TaxID=118141 RepID=UPI001863B1C7|nr:centrosomal protein of 41 kDa-like [Megalops cyprinoides]